MPRYITHPTPTETTWHLCYTRTHNTTAKTRGHKWVMTVLCRQWQQSTNRNTTQTSTSHPSQYPISHLSAQMTWSEGNVPNSNSQHYYSNTCKDLKINSNSIWCMVTLAQDDYTPTKKQQNSWWVTTKKFIRNPLIIQPWQWQEFNNKNEVFPQRTEWNQFQHSKPTPICRISTRSVSPSN